MTPAELLSTLREFHRERLTMRQRHVAQGGERVLAEELPAVLAAGDER